jgi:hypothetical protein
MTSQGNTEGKYKRERGCGDESDDREDASGYIRSGKASCPSGRRKKVNLELIFAYH